MRKVDNPNKNCRLVCTYYEDSRNKITQLVIIY